VHSVDAEWEPYSGSDAPSPVSILQVATVERVWIVDCLALASPQSAALRRFWGAAVVAAVVLGGVD
jgi:hypothetical protein